MQGSLQAHGAAEHGALPEAVRAAAEAEARAGAEAGARGLGLVRLLGLGLGLELGLLGHIAREPASRRPCEGGARKN